MDPARRTTAPDALDDRNDTPWLVTEVTDKRGHVDHVERVPATDIHVSHVSHPGWTALPEAVGTADATTSGLSPSSWPRGPDATIPDRDGTTAMAHAQARGHAAIVRPLGAD